ncbi:flagellar assembly protein FliH [Sphingomonas changnyeongensis]|uniref:Flagellar assembly protein FliH n=1 Tax=Sphingomonas changnyeongensis TaxID=2698679 RepID=A0A7Z2NTV6_9SPHN|nr:FliH/SctL family protein [Sphingomonas changnyeongensis]QHL89753.1 flagellar assembly protein FliH [Sphingomonas changnyeongensis]
MSMHVKPFAFDRVFAVPTAEAERSPEALRLEIEHLELEVLRLKREIESETARARAEAFQQAVDQVRAEREAALLAAVDALQAGFEAMDERLDAAEERLAREGGAIALAAADYLAARALADAPTAAIDDAIGRVLRQVRRGQPVQIRVHPDLVADVEALVAARQSADRRRLNLTVVGDAGLGLGDAQLLWDQGGLALDAEARRAAVAQEMAALFPGD